MVKKTTDLGNGNFNLAWVDDDEKVCVDMTIHITGEDTESTIEANYRLMKKNNEALFVEPESMDIEDIGSEE